MPPGGESAARGFYVGVLGMTEVPKPVALAGRGGVWFRSGQAELHLGVEPDFRSAHKAHPGLLVAGLPELLARCRAAGYQPQPDSTLEGYERAYLNDPFGNRIELLSPLLPRPPQ